MRRRQPVNTDISLRPLATDASVTAPRTCLLHTIGPNDTATSVAVKYGLKISDLNRMNDRTVIADLQSARTCLGVQQLTIPVSAAAEALATSEQSDPLVQELDTKMRQVSSRLFIEKEWATILLQVSECISVVGWLPAACIRPCSCCRITIWMWIGPYISTPASSRPRTRPRVSSQG